MPRKYIQNPLRAKKELGMTLHAGEQFIQGDLYWNPKEPTKRPKKKGKKGARRMK